jgi:hypothetical protein
MRRNRLLDSITVERKERDVSSKEQCHQNRLRPATPEILSLECAGFFCFLKARKFYKVQFSVLVVARKNC